MIIAVGIDMVEVERIRRAYQRRPVKFLERCFHPEELELLRGRADIVPGLAVRFAAKEAFAKVWTGGLSWTDVWVVKEGRRPVYSLSPNLHAELASNRMAVHLSLTHTTRHGAAVAVLEAHDGDAGGRGG
ncbi:MAG TPA: holo-ACP synthase [Trueperaceae bacterium]|nr:holo-ACP synthase [Trueperaceae bacterium]